MGLGSFLACLCPGAAQAHGPAKGRAAGAGAGRARSPERHCLDEYLRYPKQADEALLVFLGLAHDCDSSVAAGASDLFSVVFASGSLLNHLGCSSRQEYLSRLAAWLAADPELADQLAKLVRCAASRCPGLLVYPLEGSVQLQDGLYQVALQVKACVLVDGSDDGRSDDGLSLDGGGDGGGGHDSGGGSRGPGRPALLVSHKLSRLDDLSAMRQQEMALSTIPSIVTALLMDGRVVYQNPRSQAYMGNLVGAHVPPPGSSLAALGGSAHPLRRLFRFDEEALAAFEAAMGCEAEFRRVVKVPKRLRGGGGGGSVGGGSGAPSCNASKHVRLRERPGTSRMMTRAVNGSGSGGGGGGGGGGMTSPDVSGRRSQHTAASREPSISRVSPMSVRVGLAGGSSRPGLAKGSAGFGNSAGASGAASRRGSLMMMHHSPASTGLSGGGGGGGTGHGMGTGSGMGMGVRMVGGTGSSMGMTSPSPRGGGGGSLAIAVAAAAALGGGGSSRRSVRRCASVVNLAGGPVGGGRALLQRSLAPSLPPSIAVSRTASLLTPGGPLATAAAAALAAAMGLGSAAVEERQSQAPVGTVMSPAAAMIAAAAAAEAAAAKGMANGGSGPGHAPAMNGGASGEGSGTGGAGGGSIHGLAAGASRSPSGRSTPHRGGAGTSPSNPCSPRTGNSPGVQRSTQSFRSISSHRVHERPHDPLDPRVASARGSASRTSAAGAAAAGLASARSSGNSYHSPCAATTATSHDALAAAAATSLRRSASVDGPGGGGGGLSPPSSRGSTSIGMQLVTMGGGGAAGAYGSVGGVSPPMSWHGGGGGSRRNLGASGSGGGGGGGGSGSGYFKYGGQGRRTAGTDGEDDEDGDGLLSSVEAGKLSIALVEVTPTIVDADGLGVVDSGVRQYSGAVQRQQNGSTQVLLRPVVLADGADGASASPRAAAAVTAAVAAAVAAAAADLDDSLAVSAGGAASPSGSHSPYTVLSSIAEEEHLRDGGGGVGGSGGGVGGSSSGARLSAVVDADAVGKEMALAAGLDLPLEQQLRQHLAAQQLLARGRPGLPTAAEEQAAAEAEAAVVDVLLPPLVMEATWSAGGTLRQTGDDGAAAAAAANVVVVPDGADGCGDWALDPPASSSAVNLPSFMLGPLNSNGNLPERMLSGHTQPLPSLNLGLASCVGDGDDGRPQSGGSFGGGGLATHNSGSIFKGFGFALASLRVGNGAAGSAAALAAVRAAAAAGPYSPARLPHLQQQLQLQRHPPLPAQHHQQQHLMQQAAGAATEAEEVAAEAEVAAAAAALTTGASTAATGGGGGGPDASAASDQPPTLLQPPAPPLLQTVPPVAGAEGDSGGSAAGLAPTAARLAVSGTQEGPLGSVVGVYLPQGESGNDATLAGDLTGTQHARAARTFGVGSWAVTRTSHGSVTGPVGLSGLELQLASQALPGPGELRSATGAEAAAARGGLVRHGSLAAAMAGMPSSPGSATSAAAAGTGRAASDAAEMRELGHAMSSMDQHLGGGGGGGVGPRVVDMISLALSPADGDGGGEGLLTAATSDGLTGGYTGGLTGGVGTATGELEHFLMASGHQVPLHVDGRSSLHVGVNGSGGRGAAGGGDGAPAGAEAERPLHRTWNAGDGPSSPGSALARFVTGRGTAGHGVAAATAKAYGSFTAGGGIADADSSPAAGAVTAPVTGTGYAATAAAAAGGSGGPGGGSSGGPPRRRNTKDRLMSLLTSLSRDESDDEEADGGGCGEHEWHDVSACVRQEGGSGRPVVVVTQTVVTEQVEVQRKLEALLEHEHKVLESIFPRHVIEHMTLQAKHRSAAASSNAGGGSAVGPSWAQFRGSAMEALATSHSCVTVLFCDIIGFTEMCKQVSAMVVMRFLNTLYMRFDELIDIYGVYKVETIGDCYMCAGGLVRTDGEGNKSVIGDGSEDALHAVRVMSFAKAIVREAGEVVLPTTGEPVQLRIGLHSGPVMSGIVGDKMPRFCLFGDTVNTASRMESTCPPGAIHVSADTQCLLRNEAWEATGGVQVKGKGLLETYTWAGHAAEEDDDAVRRLKVYL